MSDSYNEFIDSLWCVPTTALPQKNLFEQDKAQHQQLLDKFMTPGLTGEASYKELRKVSRNLRENIPPTNILLIQGTKLAVLAYVCRQCGKRKSLGRFASTQNKVAAAIGKAQQAVSRAVVILDKEEVITAEPLDANRRDAGTVFSVRSKPIPLKECLNLLNETYVTIPNIATDNLEKYTGDALDLLVGLSNEAHIRGWEFVISTKQLRICSGICKHSKLTAAIGLLHDFFTIEAVDKRKAEYNVTLLHPDTHKPLIEVKEEALLKREGKEYKPNSTARTLELTLLVKQLLNTNTQHNGEEAMARCPRCKGPNAITVDTKRNYFGLVCCHNEGCGLNKNCRDGAQLVQEVFSVSREDAIKMLQGQTIKQPVLAGEGVTI